MIKRTAYSSQMTFDVPDSERRVAEKASECFEELVGLLRLATDHLDIIYEPFNKQENLDTEEVLQYRVALRRYRDKIKENFEKVLKKANRCLILMSEFSTDTRTVEMMNSFMASLDDVKRQANQLLSLFSDIGNAEFRNGIVNGVMNLRKQSLQLRQLINDRILAHIDTNILANNWVSNVTDQYQKQVYNKTPLIIQLFKERQKAINES